MSKIISMQRPQLQDKQYCHAKIRYDAVCPQNMHSTGTDDEDIDIFDRNDRKCLAGTQKLRRLQQTFFFWRFFG